MDFICRAELVQGRWLCAPWLCMANAAQGQIARPLPQRDLLHLARGRCWESVRYVEAAVTETPDPLGRTWAREVFLNLGMGQEVPRVSFFFFT